MMMTAIHRRALLPVALTTLSLTPSRHWVATFYSAPQLELLPLILLLQLVTLSGALRIETKHVLNRNGNNAFNSTSRLSEVVVILLGKGYNSSQQQAFLSSSKLIRIHLLLLPVIPLVPSRRKVLLFKSLLLEEDLMQRLQPQLHLVELQQESRQEEAQRITALKKSMLF